VDWLVNSRFMKMFLYISFFIVFVSCQTENRKQSVSEAGKAAPEGQFVVRKEFHNFGELKEGESVAYSFWFKNGGEAALKISGSETDCGCIQVSVPDEAVMPGDSAYVEVVYNSAGDVGKVLKTITLFANTKKKKIQFHIIADVKSEWIELK